jgi:hypothetical protein
MPHGIGMGGTLEKFRLFIPDSLETCEAHSNCLTYEPGSLLLSPLPLPASGGVDTSDTTPQGPSIRSSSGDYGSRSSFFTIDVMEIWGCGGDLLVNEALEAQSKDRGERDDLIRKARKVDKAAFAGNVFDQEFLLPKNFSHKVRMADESACAVTEAEPKRDTAT